MPELTPSIIGEMKFAIRAMLHKKQREQVRMVTGDPNLKKVQARIGRLLEAQAWLRAEEKKIGQVPAED